MQPLSRSFPILLLTILVATTAISANSAWAQSTTKPSVPEFTLKVVARPFDVAPTTTTDPYTGQSKITHGGYHLANVSVDITIKNQPPHTTNYLDGIFLWYQVQFKGAYQTNWKTYSNDNSLTPYALTTYLPQQIGDYTVVSIPINSDEPLNPEGHQVGSVTNFPEGGQVNFQVRAMIGSINVIPHGGPGFSDWVEFNGQTGDWSNTQTITIPSTAQNPASTSSPTQNPTSYPFPTDDGQINISFNLNSTPFLLGTIVVLIVGLVVTVLVLVRHERGWRKTS